MFRLMWTLAAYACVAVLWVATAAPAPTPNAEATSAAATPADTAPEIALSDVQNKRPTGLALLHTSLDGLPPVPAEGVNLTLTCLFGPSGWLGQCTCPCEGEAASPFLPAALKRAQAMEIRSKADGAPITAGRLTFVVTIGPRDRFENPSVDFAKGDRLKFDALPTVKALTALYPKYALKREVNATLDMLCVVQNNMSVVCPDIRVYPSDDADDPKLIAAFTETANTIAGRIRVGPIMQDGKPSAGIAFRYRTQFVTQVTEF